MRHTPKRYLEKRRRGRYNAWKLMSRHRRNPQSLDDPKLSVVIPVYNEKDTLYEILRRVIEDPTRKEIILVDDCSKDGTREKLEKIVQLQKEGAQAAPEDGGEPLS